MPKILIKGERKLISPTKETYLTSRQSDCKFSENLLTFRNNVPMYLFDLNVQENRDQPLFQNKFRDNTSRVRSTSPKR
jgi:hypothetical protein